MHFHLITIFPDMLDALHYGVVGRAIDNKIIWLHRHNPRDFADSAHGYIDDRPYGGGPGMVMQAPPLAKAIAAAKNTHPDATTLYLSPQGKPLTQALAKTLSQQTALILLAGRYEGVDQRLLDSAIDQEISVGDFIVSGGELPAMLLIDAITRLLPNVLGEPQSAIHDSFSDHLLDHPCYTRPEQFAGLSVPNVLKSGDHQAIRRWRLQQSLGKTWQKRPDLIKRRVLNNEEARLLQQYITAHNLTPYSDEN